MSSFCFVKVLLLAPEGVLADLLEEQNILRIIKLERVGQTMLVGIEAHKLTHFFLFDELRDQMRFLKQLNQLWQRDCFINVLGPIKRVVVRKLLNSIDPPIGELLE